MGAISPPKYKVWKISCYTDKCRYASWRLSCRHGRPSECTTTVVLFRLIYSLGWAQSLLVRRNWCDRVESDNSKYLIEAAILAIVFDVFDSCGLIFKKMRSLVLVHLFTLIWFGAHAFIKIVLFLLKEMQNMLILYS